MSSKSEPSRYPYERSTAFPVDDFCEELLSNKINELDLNECNRLQSLNQFCDGSDSGVDIATTALNVATLQRALSNNSGDYASSTCGGLDELTNGFNGNISCDSSMISYSSDMCEIKSMPTNIGECYSENGSESSSVTGPCIDGQIVGTPVSSMSGRKLMNSIKKKVAMFEPHGSKEKEVNTTPTSTTAGQLNSNSRIRTRLVGSSRTASLPRHNTVAATPPPLVLTRERARSREKSISSAAAVTAPNNKMQNIIRSQTLTRPKPIKPDSLPSALTTATPLVQRKVQRTPSLSRARTPGTPSDDGRWPSSLNSRASSASKRGLSATPDLSAMKMRANMLSMDLKSTNPYGTLPRHRKQKSVEDLTGGRSSRSSSTSRDPFKNPRMVSSVIGLSTRKSLIHSYSTHTSTFSNTTTKMLPQTASARSKQPALPRTKIYHETSAQTAITTQDLEKILAGTAPLFVAVDAIEMLEKQTQADMRDKEMERLHDEIRMLAQRESELATKLHERTQRATQLELQLKKEREEKISIQRELHLNTERVMGMLELARISITPTDDDVQCDSLLMLESQIQMSGHELIEKQAEISKLRKLCRTLQVEMERSLFAQENLLQEKVAIEQESNELQDFLQHEKAAMCDALKDMEEEFQSCKRLLENKDEEIKVLRDECRHLVRLNEQRRQENRLMQSKYSALETKSKELITQQNSAVSGASMSLLGLHSRLDSLVEQLVSSYNISEQELEDMIFHNEIGATTSDISCNEINTGTTSAYRVGNSNGIDSNYAQLSDGSLSPQRNQSFIAAVISAIRHATTPSGKKLLSRSRKPVHNEHTNTNGEDSDSTTEMLDSETEPCCLMMDNVLEDVTMPDSHSHNMVSSTCTATGGIMRSSQIELPQTDIAHSGEVAVEGDESLQNLSQAITNRQQIELQMNSMSVQKASLQYNTQRANSFSEDISCHDSVAEMPSLAEYCSAQTVVDQVIAVDNIVTKLLKVLRLIQMDNDSCIQQLILDKNKLQQNKEDMLEKLKDLQDVNIKLQDDLMDATQDLLLKNSDLSNSKAEVQRHRNEIDRLTEDICNLSTLFSNYKKLSPTTDLQADVLGKSNDDENARILNLLKMWQQDGQLKEANLDILRMKIEECNANGSHADDGQNVFDKEMELQTFRHNIETVQMTTTDNMNANDE